MRKKMIAANWKMHAAPSGWDADDSPYRGRDGVDIVVFPTFLDIRNCVEKFLSVGAQYGRPEADGAFTGDISMRLLADHGCTYVLCGHSERRQHHGETDTFVAAQIEAALASGLHPILCIGETAEERESGEEKTVITKQLSSLPVTGDASVITIAYEPVWAIGSGKTATESDIQDMHSFIRSLLPAGISENMRIIYGGSVKPDNAAGILALPDVDGALVGGASLDPRAFRSIVDSLPS